MMIRRAVALVATTSVIAALAALGVQDKPAAAPTSAPAPPPPLAPGAGDRAALEKSFKEALTGVVLKGTWQMTNEAGLRGLAPLGAAKQDKYTIRDVEKISDDYWLITARIQYADKDISLPVTVRVVWAGDTPVITIDNMGFPGMGAYSARVMIYRGFYSGTWFGGNYGGVMSGQIVKLSPQTPDSITEAKQAEGGKTP